MHALVAIALAGGRGIRARPLTLEGPGHIRSKAALSFLGRPLVAWQVEALRAQGLRECYVAANGRENRFQVKDALGYGERFGLSVRYSRPRADRHNTGSGQATLAIMEEYGLRGHALVFPTDSLFEFDLAELVRDHLAGGAVVTIATVTRPAAQVAGTYGTLVTEGGGWVRRFVEKPPLPVLESLPVDPARVPVNAGLYLVDCAQLRRLGPELAGLPALDWGGDLLPWLLRHGHKVRASPIGKIGDLGNPRDYLITMAEAMGGGFPSLRLDGPAIHESSLARRDAVSGLTLRQKLAEGLVRVSGNVWIGREVEIGPGVTLRDCHVGDEADLHAWCSLERVACLDGAMIGPGARVRDAHVGVMARIDSSLARPTVIDGFTALGHEARVAEGAHLVGASLFPACGKPGAPELS
ncbi:MAG: NDP-sugar synthase [Nonomuraea sp.]|nr:NDP-sugar synthase [Nonomuraea sp.]